MKHVITNRETTSRRQIDFGVKDEKERAVGIKVVLGTAKSKERTTEGSYHQLDIPCGRLFTAWIMITRNGEEYGAMSTTQYFKTEESRKAVVAKRVEAARKRMLRKYRK